MFRFRACFPIPLGPHESDARLWARLRVAFPWTVSAVVGPGEVQLLTHVASPDAACGRLFASLRASGRDVSAMDIRAARVEADRWAGADATVLAVPADRGWVGHPLAWGWSTARDVAGAVIDPWVAPAHHRRQLRQLRPEWPLRALHGLAVPALPLARPLASDAAAAALRLHTASASRDPRALALAKALAQPGESRRVPGAWLRAGLRAAAHPQLLRFVRHLPDPAVRGGVEPGWPRVGLRWGLGAGAGRPSQTQPDAGGTRRS